MSFRMKIAYNSPGENKEVKNDKKYTQDDIDIIDQKFKEKEKRFKKFVSEPVNPLIEEYRKNLIASSEKIQTEKIVFDPITQKWILDKE
jgi:hypothetical protein